MRPAGAGRRKKKIEVRIAKSSIARIWLRSHRALRKGRSAEAFYVAQRKTLGARRTAGRLSQGIAALPFGQGGTEFCGVLS